MKATGAGAAMGEGEEEVFIHTSVRERPTIFRNVIESDRTSRGAFKLCYGG